ncbi:MAG: phosphoesterase [Pirellulales bacterium]
MSTATTEHVLVVPTARFHELGYFQGFCGEPERYWDALLGPHQTLYRPRSEMETDPSFKQLIPYVVFRYRPADGEPQLFCYQRGKGQGEQRLHAKWSVGVGGHISLGDGHLVHEAYAEGMRRELDEEVIIDTPFSQTCVGLINDDQTEVGRVHLGVVHLVDVDRPDVRPRESELLGAGFQSLTAIRDRAEQLESWSRICIEALFGL